MTDDWKRLLEAVAGETPTQASFDVCFDIARREVECRVMTVTLHDAAVTTVERLYSSRPESWAVGGRKPMSFGIWADTVIGARKPFVANSYAEMAAVFNDHPVSEALGLGAIVNVPIFFGGIVRGTVNVLNAPGFYDADRVERTVGLAPFFTMAMLTAL
ncbi:MAG: GAF domain-containing protein [Rhodovulum sulfidophilum]|uniref:GAF domain-containing protein n=1 Tax=Rhodovulum sulfidophilum TaxID=35806 RepID=A0A2W5Q052_RHOSU|nr:MAG: GAF domain-containing protein [Rhodovulum sulfidophilum]